MKRTKEQAINDLQNSLSSIYTKDDVIKLIESIECNQKRSEIILSQMTDLKNLRNKIVSKIKSVDSHCIVSEDNIELSLSGFELSIDSIDVNYDSITDEVEEIFSDEISDLEEDLETAKETEEEEN